MSVTELYRLVGVDVLRWKAEVKDLDTSARREVRCRGREPAMNGLELERLLFMNTNIAEWWAQCCSDR